MYWVYILGCENEIIYVGMTRRLYKRFWQHDGNRGGRNTSTFRPIRLIGLYPIHKLEKYIEFEQNKCISAFNWYVSSYNIYFDRYENENLYDFNYTDEDYDLYNNSPNYYENFIVEKIMNYYPDNWKNIRGGKYVRFDCEYNFPSDSNIRIPFCNCGLPSDIHESENGKLFFRCCIKNIYNRLRYDLEDIGIEIKEEACSFYEEYHKNSDYINYKNILDNKLERKLKVDDIVRKNYYWLKTIKGLYQYCIGGCGKSFDGDNTIRVERRALNLCFDCLTNKTEELKNKYNKPKFNKKKEGFVANPFEMK